MRTIRLCVVAAVLAALLAGCSPVSRQFATVQELYAAAGGEAWCDGELTVTLEPYVGNCGDPSGDGRVVLGISAGGEEVRTSIDRARENLVGDDQLLLVGTDPDAEWVWQLRSRDRRLLEAAAERIGGTLLDDEDAVDAWLGG